MKLHHLSIALGILTATAFADEEGFTPMFNGRDLSGWVNVNCSPETWAVRDGMITCTGTPTGALRTEKQYENPISVGHLRAFEAVARLLNFRAASEELSLTGH